MSIDNTRLQELIVDVREHVIYLHELGVEVVDVNLPVIEGARDVTVTATPAAVEDVAREVPTDVVRAVTKPAGAAEKKRSSRLGSIPSLSKKRPAAPLRSEAAQITEMRDTTAPLADAAAETVQIVSDDTIETIRAEIGDCVRCPLHAGRTQIVHSTGNFNAKLMFVGEAPGADEDAQGVPFIGRAGQLLTRIIESIGLTRDDVFIGNINRCRPPGNRAPLPEETAACRPFLLREIDVIKPRVIVVLGATAAHNLLQIKTPISKLRGEFHEYFGVKVMPTFHPAYLLRDPHKKRDVWDDMKKVRDFLNEQVQ